MFTIYRSLLLMAHFKSQQLWVARDRHGMFHSHVVTSQNWGTLATAGTSMKNGYWTTGPDQDPLGAIAFLTVTCVGQELGGM